MIRRSFLASISAVPIVVLSAVHAGCYLQIDRAVAWRSRVGTWGEQVAPWGAR